MGRFAFDSAGIEKIRNLLTTQVQSVQTEFGYRAFDFFISFGYHAGTGGSGTHSYRFEQNRNPDASIGRALGSQGGGWTYYYLVNWFVRSGEPANTTRGIPRPADIQPGTYQKNVKGGAGSAGFMRYWHLLQDAKNSAKWQLEKERAPGMPLFITNHVYYGPWLNNGGQLEATHCKTAKANRFVEQCQTFLSEIRGGDIIRQVCAKQPNL